MPELKLPTAGFLLILLIFTGCKRDSFWEVEPNQTSQCGGPCLEGQEVGVIGAETVEGPPLPTEVSDAPVISGVEVEVNDDGFVLNVSFSSEIQIGGVYFQIGDVYYRFPVNGVTDPNPYFTKQACDVLADQQGHECTESCLEACACVRCDSEQTSMAMVQACAVPCSLYAINGWSDVEVLYLNEQDYAYKIYNGTHVNGERVAGVLDNITFCEASQCEPLDEEPGIVGVPFIGPDYSDSLAGITAMGSAIYVETKEVDSRGTLVSQPFDGGRICASATSQSSSLPINPCQ